MNGPANVSTTLADDVTASSDAVSLMSATNTGTSAAAGPRLARSSSSLLLLRPAMAHDTFGPPFSPL